ncbi:MAG: DinB family protein [Rhodospirillales bacterium]|nr:DinB family protein [Rhodospirillales bacterium]
MDLEYFQTLARYNKWANKRIYTACAELSLDEYKKQRQATFLSIHMTLNHILLIDRIWLSRIRNKKITIKTLRKELYTDRAALRIARKLKDDKIILVLKRFRHKHLDKKLEYEDRRGQFHSNPTRYILGHMFNHATHHRGNVHDMLSQTSAAPPSIDLIDFVRHEQAKKEKKKGG